MSQIAELNETAEIKIDGQSYQFPVVVGTENEKAIDISKLRASTGYVTLDYGFKNTGSTQSGITFLNGEAGILRYRGYAIEDLAEKAHFLEVAYLIIFGKLPTQEEFKNFSSDIKEHLSLPENVKQMLNAFPTNSHPMGMLSSIICSLSGFYPESLDPYRPEDLKELTYKRLIAKIATISAWIFRKNNGFSYIDPDPSLDYNDNWLKMMFSKDGENYVPVPAVSKALNKLLILHADHEQNCSTSTVRVVGSAHANLYASISAGVNALWGPLHGGANQAVIEMLENIKADGGDTEKWLNKAKDKEDPFRLMGFGHRVYKNFDPRATIIKAACDEVLEELWD